MVSLLLVLFTITIVWGDEIPVGGVFEGLDQDQEIAFRVAIDEANTKYQLNGNVFTPLIANIEPEAITDHFHSLTGITWERPYAALVTACSLLKSGIVAILSPLSENNANSIQSVCDAKEIPFIRTTVDRERERECCSINLFPDPATVSNAFSELIDRWEWKSFTVLYDSTDTFLNIASILQFYNVTGRLVLIQELKKNHYGNYITVLERSRDSGQTNFVLHCELENLDNILREAQKVGIIMRKYSFIIMNLDLHTVDLSRYQYSKANITALQLVNPLNPKVIKIAEAMNEKRKELGLDLEITNANIAAWQMKTSTALLVDALMLFAETLSEIGEFDVTTLTCNSSDSWEHGSTIYNYMKMKTMTGLTGSIQFDYDGVRNSFDLDVIELREGGVVKIGTWDAKEGLNIERPTVIEDDEDGIDENNLKNTSIRVMIAWSEPYALYKNDTLQLVGNDQYEGFAIDLINELSLLEGFSYTFIRNEDDKNGDYNETTKTWNGMIGDLLNDKGDIAIGDLTITRKRQEVVDFTTPFMSLGIQIVYKNPTKPTPRFFSFADPFAPIVWLLIGVSFFIVSFGLYVMARFCPKEWDNWDSCVQNPRFYVNQFNVRNSLWFTLGCLMQQGADIAPRGISTRVLSSVWAFFILVIVSYYKAQLAASLTVENTELSFKSLEELVSKADELGIKYGAVENEAIHSFFMQSKVGWHQKVADYMKAHPELMVEDNYGGYLMVEEQNYAFITDSLMAEFITSNVCYLTAIGNPFNEQNFAIAVKKNSPYRTPLSNGILRLLESGKIYNLQRFWWENNKFTVDACQKTEVNTEAPPLNYNHVSGIFWITFGGIGLACIWVFIELAVHIIKKSVKSKKLFLKEYIEEIKFGFSLNHSVKSMRDGRISTVFNQTNLHESSTENLQQ